MDIVTVLTKIVQEQQGLIMEQRKAAEEQRDINVALYNTPQKLDRAIRCM